MKSSVRGIRKMSMTKILENFAAVGKDGNTEKEGK